MRKSRFAKSQIVDILKQGEGGVPIAEVLRQHNISKAGFERAFEPLRHQPRPSRPRITPCASSWRGDPVPAGPVIGDAQRR